jgi:hydrogenase expression/formation protein HypE
MNIENQIQSDNAPLNGLVEALFAAGLHPKTMRDITRGGLGTVLNELAQSSGVGIRLEEERIPVSRSVQGFSEILGLDPLYMGNEGKLVLSLPWEEGEKALAALREQEKGKDVAIVGRVVEGTGVELLTRLGGLRRVPPLVGEGLPRIC